MRGLLDVPRNLPGRGLLLLHGGRNGSGDFGNSADRAGNPVDGDDRTLSGGLHARDLRADLLGRLRRLRGERLHLLRDHREAPSRFPGPGGLDRGIQSQQSRLLRDRTGDHSAPRRGGLRSYRPVSIARIPNWCGRGELEPPRAYAQRILSPLRNHSATPAWRKSLYGSPHRAPRARARVRCWSMIPKSGYRFSEKIMLQE